MAIAVKTFIFSRFSRALVLCQSGYVWSVYISNVAAILLFEDKNKLNEDMIVAVVVLRMREGIKNGILD